MAVTVYKRQRQILDYISQYIQKTGFSPTLSEIARAISVHSLATVHEHLRTMEKKGIIQRTHGKIRSIEISPRIASNLDKEFRLPVLGFIAAGQPIEPYTDPNVSMGIPPSFITGNRRSFILQVRGNSMTEDGILEGDYVVVEEQPLANNGDIVVAILENGFATLKRFYKEATRVRLEPANSQMSPIFAKNVRIQGKVVGVIRRY